MSNWENRPLRLSQQHYGALDAYALVEIMEKLIKEAEDQMLDDYTSHVYTQDIRNEEVREEDNKASTDVKEEVDDEAILKKRLEKIVVVASK